MARIRNFAEANDILAGFVSQGTNPRKGYDLGRMYKLMEALGNPQNSYKVIHVAGTSGKTSTAYFITALLDQAGKKVGLTVSPHVDEVNERVQINLEPLPEVPFCEAFSDFLNRVDEIGIKPTYPEATMAFAFWEFARQNVDYAVIEVGVGGLLDGSNVISRPDKVCVITDIGLDHTDLLGNTITAIAAQKAGIIQPNNHVFMYDQGEAVMGAVQDAWEQQQATLHEVPELKSDELPDSLVMFQQRNWQLARNVYEFVAQRDDLPHLNDTELTATANVQVPARMEILKLNAKTVVLDGAHNAQKMKALVDSMERRFTDQPIAVLIGMLQTEEFKLRTTLQQIVGVASHVIITSYGTDAYMTRRSVDPEKLAEYCLDLDFDKVTISEDPIAAFELLLQRPEPVLLVTGSFYLLNHIRPRVRDMKTKQSTS